MNLARVRGAGGGRTGTAARTPFVLLVVALLAGGLITLLLLNAAVNQDSFELNKLQKETTTYTDEEQALQQEVDEYSAPDALARRARELGMVPGSDPAFLGPDGSVRGRPQPATGPAVPPPVPPSSPTAAAPGPARSTASGTSSPPTAPASGR